MLERLNLDGVEFPSSLHDMDTFEKLNPDFSINVYSTDEGSVITGSQNIAENML